MIIDILCYVGLGVLALMGIGLLAAMAFTVAVVIREKHER